MGEKEAKEYDDGVFLISLQTSHTKSNNGGSGKGAEHKSQVGVLKVSNAISKCSFKCHLQFCRFKTNTRNHSHGIGLDVEKVVKDWLAINNNVNEECRGDERVSLLNQLTTLDT